VYVILTLFAQYHTYHCNITTAAQRWEPCRNHDNYYKQKLTIDGLVVSLVGLAVVPRVVLARHVIVEKKSNVFILS